MKEINKLIENCCDFRSQQQSIFSKSDLRYIAFQIRNQLSKSQFDALIFELEKAKNEEGSEFVYISTNSVMKYEVFGLNLCVKKDTYQYLFLSEFLEGYNMHLKYSVLARWVGRASEIKNEEFSAQIGRLCRVMTTEELNPIDINSTLKQIAESSWNN